MNKMRGTDNNSLKNSMGRADAASCSKRLRAMFAGMAACAFLLGVANLAQAIGKTGSVPGLPPAFGAASVLAWLQVGLAAAVVVFLVFMLADAVSMPQPFSRVQARRLFRIGLLLASSALLQLVTDSGLLGQLANMGGLMAPSGAVPDAELSQLGADFLLIVAAIVCFNLSCMIKYGCFLQWFYDETV